jgi:UDP-glucose 4-epimerase
VARRLLARGDRVTVLSSSSRLRAPVPSGAELAVADLRDREAIGRVVAAGRFEGVCHLAALAQARGSVADPVGYFDVNVTGTLNLLHALDRVARDDRADRGARLGRAAHPVRLVFSSTGAVYGSRDGTLDEDEPARPVNPYGSSKLAAEQVIGHQAANGRLAAVTLRCFNIAGADGDRRDDDLSRMIPKTLAVAAGHAESLQINGDGGAVREYTHVLDVAAAIELALKAAVPGRHRIYNVGSGQGVSLADLVEAARRITGRPIPAEHGPAQPEARVLMADSRRIRHELGWRPKHSSLEQILADGWAAVQAAG